MNRLLSLPQEGRQTVRCGAPERLGAETIYGRSALVVPSLLPGARAGNSRRLEGSALTALVRGYHEMTPRIR